MLGCTLGVAEYMDRVCREIRQLDFDQVENLSRVIEGAYHAGRFVFIIGNGGSGANASHLSEDLAKCTLRDFETQKRLKVLSLTDNTAGIMAWGNDEGYDRIFVEQLKNLASPGDVLVAISGSGNSPNILKAVDWANAHGLTTVGVTGFQGGRLHADAHHNLHVAIDDMGIVESVHLIAFHWVIDDLNRRFAVDLASAEAVPPAAAWRVHEKHDAPPRAAASPKLSPSTVAAGLSEADRQRTSA